MLLNLLLPVHLLLTNHGSGSAQDRHGHAAQLVRHHRCGGCDGQMLGGPLGNDHCLHRLLRHCPVEGGGIKGRGEKGRSSSSGRRRRSDLLLDPAGAPRAAVAVAAVVTAVLPEGGVVAEGGGAVLADVGPLPGVLAARVRLE